jgi:hypothetical protein
MYDLCFVVCTKPDTKILEFVGGDSCNFVVDHLDRAKITQNSVNDALENDAIDLMKWVNRV